MQSLNRCLRISAYKYELYKSGYNPRPRCELSDLGLSSEHQLVSILAFNLGVELGRLGILLVVLPLLFLIRRFSLYSLLVLKLGSFLIGLTARNWTIQRI